MNVERAFARREQLLARLAAIEADAAHWRYESKQGGCPESATGHVANGRGACCWCGKKVEHPGRVTVRKPYDPMEDVTDPVTLEPVSSLEREESRALQWLQSFRGRP